MQFSSQRHSCRLCSSERYSSTNNLHHRWSRPRKYESGYKTPQKKKNNYALIAPLNLLRAEVLAGTERGEIENIMKEGRNIPADIVVQLIRRKMISQAKSIGFVVVRFPRDRKQTTIFGKNVQSTSLVNYLTARESILEDRTKSRAAANERFDETAEII
ncbi:adenylate kinase isoenzyme 1-like [Cephus cinctus]|uniref:Adenylate kinase isoenzyme 1-like n=1 Tax=Cephus cinctus TaxID=211228 RepID=A0AAJ7RDK2_CEPCN|nr:adenylate kinase isoenzyme 1-like [Cephus cinctus]